MLNIYFYDYCFGMNNDQWNNASKITGMTKKEINKYLWDQQQKLYTSFTINKIDPINPITFDKTQKYPEWVIFVVTDCKNMRDLTPTDL